MHDKDEFVAVLMRIRAEVGRVARRTSGLLDRTQSIGSQQPVRWAQTLCKIEHEAKRQQSIVSICRMEGFQVSCSCLVHSPPKSLCSGHKNLLTKRPLMCGAEILHLASGPEQAVT